MNQLDTTVEELDRTSKPKENSSWGCLDFPSTFIGSQLMKEEKKQGQFFALDHLL
jgi:hypothetical protein